MWVDKSADPSFLVYSGAKSAEEFGGLDGADLAHRVETVYKGDHTDGTPRFNSDTFNYGARTYYASTYAAIAANNAAAAAGFAHSNNLLLHTRGPSIAQAGKSALELSAYIEKGRSGEGGIRSTKKKMEGIGERITRAEQKLREIKIRFDDIDNLLDEILERIA